MSAILDTKAGQNLSRKSAISQPYRGEVMEIKQK